MPHTWSAWRISLRVVWAAGLAFSSLTLAAQPNIALNLNDQAVAMAEKADYDRAERLYSESIQKWRELGPAYRAHTASTLVNLGQMFCTEGKWSKGVKVLEEALALHRSSLGSKHLRTVRNLSLLGQAYVSTGDLDRADAALTEALGTERELYPADLLLSGTLHGISVLRRLQGKLEEALQYGDESLSVAIKTGGELSTVAAVAYENVAVIHRLAGRPERALPLFRKARFIYRQTVGLSSPIVASLLSQEGMALLDDGQIFSAEQEMSEAVDALAKTGPACEYLFAAAESNLGLLRLRQRRLVDAERLLTHALSVEERLPSPSRFDMAATLGILAELRKAQRRYAESAQLRSRATGLQTSQ